jgi:hypothetical protein
MRERHEDYMKRRIREEDRLIHESPDGGRTIRTRAFRSAPEEQKIYDYLDNTLDTPIPAKHPQSKMIQYKYNEPQLLNDFRNYIDATYREHYSQDRFQATEFIMDGGHGTGFCIGNVLKYAQRYGKKGSRDDARKDLMKVLHYALLQLYIHDSE